MNTALSSIRYSVRTCYIKKTDGEPVGKIQFQQQPLFRVWRIKYLSPDLPVHSADTPAQVKSQLLAKGLSWQWGPLKHYYAYQRD